MENLQQYVSPVTGSICFCTGLILNKWIPDIDNKWIPTICAILGVIISSWINAWDFTPDILLNGLVSGLSATGFDQLVTLHMNNTKNE